MAFSTDAVTIPAGALPRQIAGMDARRREITVIVDSDATDPVYLVGAPSAQASSGIKLKPGAGMSLRTAAAVYVIAPTKATTVYVISETGEIG